MNYQGWDGWKEMDEAGQGGRLHENLLNYMLGNTDAVEFLEMIYYISHVWDDLIDKDVKVTEDNIHTCFWLAMVKIPSNPFYRANMDRIIHIYTVYIDQWLVANDLEKKGGDYLNQSFVLKETLMGVISQCALILGGFHHMRKVSSEIQKLELVSQTLNEYRKERRHA